MKKIVLILTIAFLFSCNSANKNPNSLYLWKTELELNNSDYEFFRENNVQNLYIRLFDVTWEEGQERPQSILQFSGEIPAEFNVIPVVYIKNEVIKNVKDDELDAFAVKLNSKISEIYKKRFSYHQITEIQIDCDWSETTRDKYFKFLEFFQQKIDKNIDVSVTIRLHQIKYQQSTGIPPVDKGVLMYYNMGELKNPDEKNSILNNEIGEQYIYENSSYPLQLSLALPIYSWGVWYNWQGFNDVIYQANVNTKNSLYYLQNISENLYKVVKDTVIEENYLREGDLIRVEIIDIEQLEKAKEICSPLFKNNFELILYSYNFENTNLLNSHDLEKIYIRR
ncbi:MAG: hypothetical protein JXL97_02535 [Bacteroidales bacterium]|nr:hypothetical protein [Bacteroidales bacterium]